MYWQLVLHQPVENRFHIVALARSRDVTIPIAVPRYFSEKEMPVQPNHGFARTDSPLSLPARPDS